MKSKLLNIFILIALVLSFVPVFLSTDTVLAVDITVDSYGAGRNDTGEPIGGGENYTGIVTTGDHLVDNKTELLAHMVGGGSEAASGTTIYIADNTAIDMTGELDLELPAGVTLAGNRGEATSLGARIYITAVAGSTYPTFLYLNSNCRITGIRLEGHDGGQVCGASTGLWTGINTSNSDNVQIDNCEIYNWGYAGIVAWGESSLANQSFIYCNYIHNCRWEGYGYGVQCGDGWSLIECNQFEYNRHSITGNRGSPVTNYEAIYNVVDHCNDADGGHSAFDCHGGNDPADGIDGHPPFGASTYAGGIITIHYNTFKMTDKNPVGIRGLPETEVTCDHNWTYLDPDYYTEKQAFRQSLDMLGLTPYIDMTVGNNLFGAAGSLYSRTGSTDTYIGTMPTQTEPVTPPTPPTPYDPPDPYTPPIDEDLTTTTFSVYNYYDAYLWKTNADYATAHDATTATGVDYTGTYLNVGQIDNVTASQFSVYRGELQFNTVALDSHTSIDGARLWIWCKADNFPEGGSVNVQIVKGSTFGSPPVTADYGYYTDNTPFGTINTSAGLPTDCYVYITLSDEGIANVVRGGITKFGLMSTEDIADSEPTALEYGEFWTSESEHPPYLEITYAGSDLGPPNTCEIYSARVFTDYRTPGDQLYCILYTVDYNSGDPGYIPGDYFLLQLFDTDGTTLKAQTPLPDWGWRRPASFYLSANSALPTKKKYVIKLIGVSGRFSPQIEKTRTLGTTSDTWRGKVSGTNFRTWVLTSAPMMAAHDGVTYTVKIGNETKLTADGGTIFLTGIPGLDSIRPDLFSASEQQRDWGTPGTYDPTLKNKLLNNMGTQLMTAFDNIGKSMGLSGTWVNSGLWGFFTVCVAITGLSAGLSIAGMAIGIPALMLGLFMGIPPIIGALLGTTLMFLLARTLWAARG